MCAMRRVEPWHNIDTLLACKWVPTKQKQKSIRGQKQSKHTLLDDVNGVLATPIKRAFCATAVRDTSAKRFIAILVCRVIDDDRYNSCK